MLFENYHLFQFDIGGKRYGTPDPGMGSTITDKSDAKNIRLGVLIERGVERVLLHLRLC